MNEDAELTGELWIEAARLAIAAGRRPSKVNPTPIELALAREELLAQELWPWRDPRGHLLLVRGTMPPGPRVAVVGSRAVDDYGRAVARRVALDVAAAGGVVVSGGAEGVDAEAHQAALDAGRPTIVVLGHGHDHCYPRQHSSLFHAVVQTGGALVSPFGPATRPARHRFLVRNTTIAHLADAVVVARAARRSGSLSTARAAHAAGKPLLAVPGAVGVGLSEGVNALLAAGARAVVGGEDWVELCAAGRASTARSTALELGTTSWPTSHSLDVAPWSTSAGGADDALGVNAQRVLEVLSGARSLDQDALVEQTQLTVGALNAAIVELEIVGLLSRRPGARFAAAGRLDRGHTR